MASVIQIAEAPVKIKPPQVSPERWQEFIERWAELLDIRRDLEEMEAEGEAERDELLPLVVNIPQLVRRTLQC